MFETLRGDRELTERGGFGVNRQLQSMRSSPAVFWSSRGNSYVACERSDRTGIVIYSVNGIGEIRWTVEDWNRDEESNAARSYFLVY
jgi:hypothetical protein